MFNSSMILEKLNLIKKGVWPWVKSNPLKLILIFALLIIAGSVFWRLVVWPYQTQKTLGGCVQKVREQYDKKWLDTCLDLYSEEVIKKYGRDYLCESMAALYADPVQQEYYSQIDDCLGKHRQ